MLQSLSVNSNVIPQVGQCVASPRTTSSQGCVFDQTFFLFMYNHYFKLKCSLTAGALGAGTGGQWFSTPENQFSLRKGVSMNVSFTNNWSTHGGLQGVVVYIDKNAAGLSGGFYIWVVNYEELSVSLIPFNGVLGYLQISHTLQLGFLDSTTIKYHTNQEGWEAKSVYQDFYKDRACLDHHGCSKTDYITQMIDKLIEQIDQGDPDALAGLQQVKVGYCDHHTDSFVSDCSREVSASYKVAEPVKNATSSAHCCTIRDFNIQSKTVGYLALESTHFEFIGPDRLSVSINFIETCL